MIFKNCVRDFFKKTNGSFKKRFAIEYDSEISSTSQKKNHSLLTKCLREMNVEKERKHFSNKQIKTT